MVRKNTKEERVPKPMVGALSRKRGFGGGKKRKGT